MSISQNQVFAKISYYEAALIEAKRYGNRHHVKRILQTLSILYTRERSYGKSSNCLIELVPIIEDTESQDRVAYYYLMIAKNSIWNKDYATTEEYLKRSLEIYERRDNMLGKANVFIVFSELFRKTSLMDQCVTYLTDALNILSNYTEQLKAANPISYQASHDDAVEAMSRMLLNMKLYDKGNDLLSELLRQKKISGDKKGLIRILQNIGAANCFSDPDTALVYLQEALELSGKVQDYPCYAQILSNIGVCYETKGEYEQAIRLYHESYETMIQHGLRHYYANVLNNLASAYLKSGNPSKAITHANKSIELSFHDEKIRENHESLWILSQAHKEERKFENAYDYLLKYCEINDKMFNVEIAAKLNLLQRNYEAASTCIAEIKKQFSLISDSQKKSMDMNFIGVSSSIKRVHQLAIRASEYAHTNVIVTGESGVGKEIVTRLIHHVSPGNKGPFIDVNCSAIVESLAESEFFGHTKGAFTGANYDKIGFIEAANGGTLFLDEIADTPLPIQAKLLRVLETRTMKRIGSNKVIKVDFRLISATNKNIKDLVNRGLFREDLLYRINTIEIHIPPLRERRDDIAPLVNHFLKEFSRTMNKPIPNYSNTLKLLYNYSFPGNIRELKNIIERAMITTDGNELRVGDLSMLTIAGDKKEYNPNNASSIKQMELEMIEEALKKCEGSYTKASIMLGISYSTIRRKAKGLKT